MSRKSWKTGNKHWNAYRIQKWNAKRRKIEWLFNYQEWLEWWGADVDKRGHHADGLVMARKGDKGPYSKDNVYKATQRKNGQDADHTASVERMREWHRKRKEAGIKHHLQVRGDDHPKSRAVMTPAGRFGSMALAADHYGVTRQAIFHRIRKLKEYNYCK